MEKREIKGIVEEYEREEKDEVENEGFDGVEIKEENGYMIEKLMSGGRNKRKDEYGG